MKRSALPFLLILLFSLSCKNDDSGATPITEDPIIDSGSNTTLLRVSGKQILGADNTPLQLKGIVFNNWHWILDPLPPTNHHSEIDYGRVAELGMNTVRFHLNYTIFEDDTNPYQYKETGFEWIDTNIAWARQHDIYLVLNMHTPQGGYQSQGTGDALWDDIENQNRLVALWRAIAERYKDEAQIAGYGVLNEPVPNNSIDQWSSLGQRLVDEIRTIDDHIIFLEQAIDVKGVEEPDPELNFPRVQGENLVYEFHTYEPFQFTHQLLAFANVGEGGTYPDETILEIADSQWYTAIFDNPALTTNTDWQYFEGIRFTINDPDIKIGVPVLNTGNIGNIGRVGFDDIVISEYDDNGVFIRNIAADKLNTNTGWAYWSRDDTGDGGEDTTQGRTDTSSFFISGSTEQGVLSNRLVSFRPILGYSYEISGYMKGENIASGGDAVMRLDFYTTEGEVYSRNKEYLASILDRVQAWGDAKNVPLYIGEVGTGAPSFANNKGGLLWAQDMISLCLEKNIHFTYFDYHNNNFGVYLGDNSLPDPAFVNQPLLDWFKEILN